MCKSGRDRTPAIAHILVNLLRSVEHWSGEVTHLCYNTWRRAQHQCVKYNCRHCFCAVDEVPCYKSLIEIEGNSTRGQTRFSFSWSTTTTSWTVFANLREVVSLISHISLTMPRGPRPHFSYCSRSSIKGTRVGSLATAEPNLGGRRCGMSTQSLLYFFHMLVGLLCGSSRATTDPMPYES